MSILSVRQRWQKKTYTSSLSGVEHLVSTSKNFEPIKYRPLLLPLVCPIYTGLSFQASYFTRKNNRLLYTDSAVTNNNSEKPGYTLRQICYPFSISTHLRPKIQLFSHDIRSYFTHQYPLNYVNQNYTNRLHIRHFGNLSLLH